MTRPDQSERTPTGTVTLAELAALCRRSERTIRGWRRAGKIVPVSPLLWDVFGPETLVKLGLVRPADGETASARRKRAAKALW